MAAQQAAQPALRVHFASLGVDRAPGGVPSRRAPVVRLGGPATCRFGIFGRLGRGFDHLPAVFRRPGKGFAIP
jgi:hypothetical protein